MEPSIPLPSTGDIAGRRKQLLAMDPSLGTVYVCDHCQHLHIDLGDAHFKTCLPGFQALVVLLNRAAANYELWAERNGSLA